MRTHRDVPTPLLAALAVALTASPSLAASLWGRVEVHLDLGPHGRRPDVAALGAGAPHGVPDRARSVVYLESAPQAAFGPPPDRARMDQREETFVPYVLPITVGSTVDFPNSDPIYHNVFSLSATRRFDLGRYGRGESKSVRFDRPGIVRVFCDIHSHMSAYVLVFAHAYFAATDANMAYRIDGVPPGRYTLVAWTDGRERARREVSVALGDEAVRVDFTIGEP